MKTGIPFMLLGVLCFEVTETDLQLLQNPVGVCSLDGTKAHYQTVFLH